MLMVVASREPPACAFDDYAGWGLHPLLAAMMALFMFALAGFPLRDLPASSMCSVLRCRLAITGWPSSVLTSVVSVVYYTRVVMLMYMREPNGAQPIPRLAPTTMAVLGITAVGILYMGDLSWGDHAPRRTFGGVHSSGKNIEPGNCHLTRVKPLLDLAYSAPVLYDA